LQEIQLPMSDKTQRIQYMENQMVPLKERLELPLSHNRIVNWYKEYLFDQNGETEKENFT